MIIQTDGISTGPSQPCNNTFLALQRDENIDNPPSPELHCRIPSIPFDKPDIHYDNEVHSCTSSASNSTHEFEDDVSTVEPSLDNPTDVVTERNRVRFHSRVRITSGLNRYRHRRLYHSNIDNDRFTFSADSSMSGSPSSSISAPIHSRYVEEVGKPGWGPLGKRVSLFSRDSRGRARERMRTLLKKSATPSGILPYSYPANFNERSSLTRSQMQGSMYMVAGRLESGMGPTPNPDEDKISRDIDLVFGPWPKRLLNRHWWWWYIEPILSCRCLEESDAED